MQWVVDRGQEFRAIPLVTQSRAIAALPSCDRSSPGEDMCLAACMPLGSLRAAHIEFVVGRVDHPPVPNGEGRDSRDLGYLQSPFLNPADYLRYGVAVLHAPAETSCAAGRRPSTSAASLSPSRSGS